MDEEGIQLAYTKEFAFMNICVNPKYRKPIWEDTEVAKGEKNGKE